MKRIILAFALFAALACQREIVDTPSATDPLPFPLEADKDLSTQPGDDFWQYCNGGWYARTPMPASGAVGGAYDMLPVMDGIVQGVIAKVPSLTKFYQLKDRMYDTQEEGYAYISQLQEKLPQPQNLEQAYKAIGQMIAEGLSPLMIELVTDYKDGKIVGMLSLPGSTYKYSYSDINPMIKTELGWIAEGMEMDPETLYYNDLTVFVLSVLKSQPLEEITGLLPGGLIRLYPFYSEEGLEMFNAQFSESWTKERAAVMARSYLGYEISYHIAGECVTPELKRHHMELVERLRDAFRARILKLDWMSETTRSSALDKLEKMMAFVGCPDVWYEDCMPDLSQCRSMVEAAYLLRSANVKLTKHLIGTSDIMSKDLTATGMVADGSLMLTDLSWVNAYYSRAYNSIIIFPGMMLPPLFNGDYTEAYEYGMLATAAHEITHGFDSEGAQYDAMGRKHNWWTVADKMAFEDQQDKLIRCYSTLEYDPVAFPGQYTSGAVTLAENIADLGGFLVTRDAYIKRLKEEGFKGDNFDAQLKKFHESYAHLQAVKYSAAKLQDIITTDNHSHARLRVNGVVMNTDLWYDLYGVTRDNILYLPADRRAYIW